MKKKTKTKTTFLPTNTTTFRVKLPTRLTYSLKFDVDELASVYDFRIDKFQVRSPFVFISLRFREIRNLCVEVLICFC